MFDRSVIIDTVNIAALGVGSVSNDGRLGGRSARWNSVDVPGRTGEVVVASQPIIRARPLELRFVCEADTRAELIALRDELMWRLNPRESHTFRFVDDETRESTGVCESIAFRSIKPDLKALAFEMILGVKCHDPREYATSDTVVSGIGSSDTDLPLGPEPSEASIVVSGAGTFTLTYKHSDGTTIATLTITGATAPVTIDMDTGSITDASGEAAQYLDSGSDFPFSFDPSDGDFPNSTWPTLACSSGTAEATYRKAY